MCSVSDTANVFNNIVKPWRESTSWTMTESEIPRVSTSPSRYTIYIYIYMYMRFSPPLLPHVNSHRDCIVTRIYHMYLISVQSTPLCIPPCRSQSLELHELRPFPFGGGFSRPRTSENIKRIRVKVCIIFIITLCALCIII